MKRVLVTGGAGFIGSHLADLLLERGMEVRAFDSLAAQVHGEQAARPGYLTPEVELQTGDMRDPEAVRRALEDVDAVVHLAASVGVGQSMYAMADYVAVNELGTAVLLEAIAARPVQRLVVASSMSIYGEGLARAGDGRLVEPGERPLETLAQGRFELETEAGEPLEPVPTPESKHPQLSSVYALGKYNQERMALIFGRFYKVPTVALRFFNVFGTRQALSNPYTGVLAIFAARLLNGRAPMIFEDGRQRRDFVHVRDVARAIHAALTVPAAQGLSLNVGSGRSRTIQEVACALARAVGRSELQPEITGRYRAGDIRHCFADLAEARTALGFEPQEDFDEGLVELAGWLEGQVADDRVEQATRELASRGLVA
ncbi:NAD-dependent epimerase/dehydratase family protein [Marinimicrococcus flavescens]|uniref:NAD-dependent epimerase/dehydratase family protein n=1 Tax=Marinimicrococcus flavescens TaxID=3031815 RepID=A0AAP3UZ12_9PROT|nr:NAD-dependent epimerase/dehydratase family protein [Marinimicrococcus flavescens]